MGKYNRFGESLLKDFIVTNKALPSCTWVVSAYDSNDAINQVISKYEYMYKEDCNARSVASMHSEHGKIISL